MFCMAVQHQEFSSSASSRGFSELCEILHPDDLHDAYKHTYAYIYTLSLTASAAALFRIHNTVGSAQAEPIHLHVHWMSKHWPSLPETVDYQWSNKLQFLQARWMSLPVFQAQRQNSESAFFHSTLTAAQCHWCFTHCSFQRQASRIRKSTELPCTLMLHKIISWQNRLTYFHTIWPGKYSSNHWVRTEFVAHRLYPQLVCVFSLGKGRTWSMFSFGERALVPVWVPATMKTPTGPTSSHEPVGE